MHTRAEQDDCPKQNTKPHDISPHAIEYSDGGKLLVSSMKTLSKVNFGNA
jgi:hypothetical protein